MNMSSITISDVGVLVTRISAILAAMAEERQNSSPVTPRTPADDPAQVAAATIKTVVANKTAQLLTNGHLLSPTLQIGEGGSKVDLIAWDGEITGFAAPLVNLSHVYTNSILNELRMNMTFESINVTFTNCFCGNNSFGGSIGPITFTLSDIVIDVIIQFSLHVCQFKADRVNITNGFLTTDYKNLLRTHPDCLIEPLLPPVQSQFFQEVSAYLKRVINEKINDQPCACQTNFMLIVEVLEEIENQTAPGTFLSASSKGWNNLCES